MGSSPIGGHILINVRRVQHFSRREGASGGGNKQPGRKVPDRYWFKSTSFLARQILSVLEAELYSLSTAQYSTNAIQTDDTKTGVILKPFFAMQVTNKMHAN